ncbi:hypothetical protein LX32DRAFT_13791 [Colletotrichum zoysiae]|uniref:Uncharacterized protein n=1 Tax=Colletotrichum zoysiae TaxID=1216348 RepID=A0AAD9LY52_9PEZI|nr:hypothetical protein LX32DRAFT_13791 [Colletotrichum zoysiae]
MERKKRRVHTIRCDNEATGGICESNHASLRCMFVFPLLVLYCNYAVFVYWAALLPSRATGDE